jgi:hypothetical protein
VSEALAGRRRALDVAQLGLHAGFHGSNSGDDELHAIRNPSIEEHAPPTRDAGPRTSAPEPLVEVDRINDRFA